LKQLQIHFKAKREKVWERRSHVFPPHYTPAYSNAQASHRIGSETIEAVNNSFLFCAALLYNTVLYINTNKTS